MIWRGKTVIVKLNILIKDKGRKNTNIISTNTPFYTILPDNAWKGGRCFIVAGGHSLTRFDFTRLNGELTIVVNRSAEAFEPTIWFLTDPRFIGWVESGELGEPLREKLQNNDDGLKCLVPTSPESYPPHIPTLHPANARYRLSPSMRDGIFSGLDGACNSGLGALNLAICLGADPIYLLGFDMKGGPDGRQKWHHEDYPEVQSAEVYSMFIEGFKSISEEANKKSKIINLNSQSNLQCFPFGSIEEVAPKQRPVVVSCYRKSPAYEKDIQRLKRSLLRFALEHDIAEIGDGSPLDRKTPYKATFISQMEKKHPNRSLLFLQPGAEVVRYPVIFDNLDYDIAAHFGAAGEPLCETLFFNNTAGARQFLQTWMRHSRMYPAETEQRTFQHSIAEMKARHMTDDLAVLRLPPAYCSVGWSRANQQPAPVIRHVRTSRQCHTER